MALASQSSSAGIRHTTRAFDPVGDAERTRGVGEAGVARALTWLVFGPLVALVLAAVAAFFAVSHLMADFEGCSIGEDPCVANERSLLAPAALFGALAALTVALTLRRAFVAALAPVWELGPADRARTARLMPGRGLSR